MAWTPSILARMFIALSSIDPEIMPTATSSRSITMPARRQFSTTSGKRLRQASLTRTVRFIHGMLVALVLRCLPDVRARVGGRRVGGAGLLGQHVERGLAAMAGVGLCV